ncbi:MAG: GNAT family N-acetyltransferase [Fimbriimonas sp.]
MTEIRTIRREESEDFLKLVCDTFDLDFNLAYDLFMSEPMFDLNRKWVLMEGREMVAACTTTPLVFGWGKAVGIAGVATRKSRQNEGHATKLLAKVLRESERREDGPALLLAKQTGLYDRLGFELLDRVIAAPLAVDPAEPEEPMLNDAQVQAIYNNWAEQDPNRLRRNDARWEYWKWHCRTTQAAGQGYICYEGNVLREAILPEPMAMIPLPNSTEFFGLSNVADVLELPVFVPRTELVLMGRGVPGIPQFFLTDQF